MKNKSTFSLDLAGICTSIICMIHCISIPLLILLGIDSILWAVDQEWVELTIIISSLLIGSTAFFRGYIKHKQHFIPVLFVAGFLLIVNGEAVAQKWLGIVLSVIGAAIIAYAHIQNLRWKHSSAYNN